MRFLLLNDNPVVNKLVTLSAQKTGDDLIVSKVVEGVVEGEYDLLIIDHAVYSNSLLDVLEDKISYRRSLFIAHRGEEVPEGFDKIIYKPFLPTDLVEYFSTQVAQDSDLIGDEESDDVLIEEDADETIEELDLDLDLLDSLPEIDDEEIEAFDLDDTDHDMLLSDIDELELGSIEELDDVEGGVLDEDELLEVQGLLEDDEPAIEESRQEDDEALGLTAESMEEVNDALAGLDDRTELMELGLDENDMEELLIDDELSEEGSESDEVTSDVAQGIEESMLLDEEPFEVADEMDLGELEEEEGSLDFEQTAPEAEMVTDEAEQVDDLDASVDGLEMLDEEMLSDPDGSADGALLDEDELDEALDMDAEVDIDIDDMEILDEELESAVSALSEEELAQDIDEAILNDLFDENAEIIPQSVDSSDGLDELDSLNEHDLKVALGEAEDDGGSSVSEPDDLAALLDGDDTQMTVAASDEGIEALHELTKTLRKVLKDDASSAALKGMRINVNITFGEER